MPLKSGCSYFFLFSISFCYGCFSISHQEEQMIMVLGYHDNWNKIRIDRSYLIEWLRISPKGKTSKLQLFSQQVFFHLLGIAFCHHNSEALPGEYYIYASDSCDRELNRGIFSVQHVGTSFSYVCVVLANCLVDGSVLPH